MNIGITTFTYLPNKDGVAEASRVMAEGLSRMGWETTVYTSGSPQKDPETIHGVNVRRYAITDARPGRLPTGDEPRRYVEDILGASHDVLVIQCWDSWNSQLLAPHLRGISCPIVYVSHGYGRHIYSFAKAPSLGIWSWLKWLWWSLSKLPLMMKAGRKLVFLSKRKDFGRFIDHHLACLLKHPGIAFIPNSFDEKEFQIEKGQFRSKLDLSDEQVLFLCVANYSERKNQILAMEAFLDAAIPEAVLVFVGSESNDYFLKLQNAYRLRCQEGATGQVIFCTGMSRPETIEAYVDATCFVLSARAETQPIVLLEAMAAGIPWISTDTGCVREMPGGMVVRSRSFMTKAMQRIATEPGFARSLVRNGQGHQVDAFDRESVVAKIQSLMAECLQGSTSHSEKP